MDVISFAITMNAVQTLVLFGILVQVTRLVRLEKQRKQQESNYQKTFVESLKNASNKLKTAKDEIFDRIGGDDK